MNKFTIILLVLLVLPLGGSAQEVIEGVIDLSKVDLKDNAVALNGEWEFYWKELIKPDSIDFYEKDYYPFPKLWNGGVTRNGNELTDQGYATYRIQVLLPPKTPQLALSLKEVYTSYLLYYDGFEISENGKVGKTRESSIPDWMPQIISIARYQNTLTFVLQISNFRHTKGGVSKPIMLGDQKVLSSKRDFDFSYDFLLSGCLIMGGLFFLGLFMFGQHEKSILFFALFCLTFSYRMIGSEEYAIYALYPDLSWELLIRAEYLTLFILCGIFTIYSYLLYPEDSKKFILFGFSVISAIFSLLSLFVPTVFFTQLVEPFFVLIILTIFYLIYVYWIAYKRNRVGAQYAFASTVIMFMVAVYLISVYLTPVQENTFLTFIGLILFFFFQSLILSYRFVYSLRKAKDAAETASKAKTDFLSTISHEIRTPLNAVVGISHFLINEEPRKDQKESLESLQFSAEHLTALINDILDYSKLEAESIEFEVTEVNLKTLSEKIIKAHSVWAKEKGISLVLELDEKMHPLVMTDQTRVNQVLNNLINNALKFTSKGYVKLKTILLNENEKIQTIRTEVWDSGIGIPYNKQKLIFERFTQAGSSTTREYGGTGLGLTIIRKILNIAGSEIYVKSQPNSGTVFWFDLSFRKVLHEEVDQAVQQESDTNIISGKKILLVEDNQMNVMVAEKFLKKWELHVMIAYNGQEAVEMMKENKFDLVLMDLQMPIMDGYKATRKIRTFDRKTPIIALTASALLKIRQDVIAVGMNDYITKPFNPDELRHKIAAYIKY